MPSNASANEHDDADDADDPTCPNCNNRQDDCTCLYCDRCGDLVTDECSECNRCADCCYHVTCATCDSRVRLDDYCTACERCMGCECECDVTSRKIDGDSVTWTAAARANRKSFDSARLAGIEVEYNKCEAFGPIRDWAEKWGASVHKDRSCGWECVTSPAAGDYLVRQARGLCSALTDSGARADDECGVHVHVDARDHTWADILRLVRVYAHVEPLLYIFAGQQRARSEWCRPCGVAYREAIDPHPEDPKAARQALLNAVMAPVTNNAARKMKAGISKKEGSRYVGLNLTPWLAGRTRRAGKRRVSSDTTIEFRMHRNLRDFDAVRLTGWAKLLVRLVAWSYGASDAEVRALPKNAMRALQVIAPDCWAWCLDRLCIWRRAVSRRGRVVLYTPEKGYEFDVYQSKRQERAQARRLAITLPCTVEVSFSPLVTEVG